MLKADLHIHSKEDPVDKDLIKYSGREMVDYAAKKGYDVLAFTLHEGLWIPDKLVDYAKEKGIVLIPGVEAKIEGKEVLIYNIDHEEYREIKKLKDLAKLPERALVIAPHPFYQDSKCLGKKLVENINNFHAIEYCHFYTKTFNLNKEAVRVAKKFHKPLVGTSDAHHYWQFGKTYSLVDAEKDRDSIINAVKKGKVRVVTKPISHFRFMWIAISFIFRKFFK